MELILIFFKVPFLLHLGTSLPPGEDDLMFPSRHEHGLQSCQ